MFLYVRYGDLEEILRERSVDRDGQTLEFLLTEHRDLAAARRFFKRTISSNDVPDRVVIDKSGANLAGLQAVNMILKFTVSDLRGNRSTIMSGDQTFAGLK